MPESRHGGSQPSSRAKRDSRDFKAPGSSALRSPSPYHNLGLFDTEEPLIRFDDDGDGMQSDPKSGEDMLSLADSLRVGAPKEKAVPRSLLDDFFDDGSSFTEEDDGSLSSAGNPKGPERMDSMSTDGYFQSPLSSRSQTSSTRRSMSQVSKSEDNKRPSHRERSQSPPRGGTPDKDKHLCGQCDEHHANSFYCNLCDITYCGPCWGRVGPHRNGKLGPGGIPHEKTDQVVADKLRATLEASPTDVEQEALFQNDENTAWFGVVRDGSGDSIFHDYGRYADIMNEISKATGPRPSHSNRFPGLVCFVGETGAGKSTLIKVLIELSESGDGGHQTPVVGSIRHQDVPTSGDVHLYTDPKTYLSDSPILYADCEGLAGGEREPKGARSKLLKRMNPDPSETAKRTKSFERNRRNLRHSSEREITWATTSEKQTREFAVTQLYPRLLYTFSDVVVFVLKNPRVIENVIERLVEWAAAALEMSSNQPVLPHAVIALNASELSIDPTQWDVRLATKWLMNSVKGSITKNVKFKKHAQIWRNRGKQIDTVEDLLLSYYSSIRVVRVPTIGRPKLIKDQMEKLYQEISMSLEASKKSKRDLRMLLDADELQPYLQFAFDHFSSNLDRAFDFVQASFIYNPIPSDFAGNILKLAVNMMDIWQHKLDGEGIFRELSYMVASCIMLDSARNKTRGAAEMIFPEYVEHCDNALEDFCDRYWPCEFVMKGKSKGGKDVGGRCVNVRSGHGSKGHQFKNGKVFAVGSYESKFSVESFQEEFRYLVFHSLEQLLAQLREIITEYQPEDQVAAQVHRAKVMTHFYEHVAQGRTESLVSHSTCFSCLMGSPEHALPCGHVLCTPCLHAYGQPLERDVIEITSCPLHFDTNFRWKVFLKPEAAGVRVLTLDGGGIRGIVELEILRLIEQVWGGHMRIQDFFDLIVGTSTGGLIALGLVSKDWTVEECIYHFENLCVKAFTRRLGSSIPGMSMIIESYHRSKYETAPLQEALQDAFSEDDYLFGGPRVTNPRTKVAVTATTAGTVSVLANYNRNCSDKLPYTFQRPEKLTAELKIWEAARATSAAPRIFKPFTHEPSKQVYIDGAVYHNNPIQVADLERKLLWPTEGYNIPDFVLSLGTTYNPNNRKKLIEKSSMMNIGLFGHAKSLASIAMDHIRSSLDSEKTWTDYKLQLSLPELYKDRYQRINPVLLEDPPALDDVPRMKRLQHIVRKQMKGDISISRAAHRLMATSFYFEKIMPIDTMPDGTLRCTGMIRCRLPRTALREFGRFLSSSHERTSGPYFIVRDLNRPQAAEQILITPDMISDLMLKLQWRMQRLEIPVSNMLALTEIVLCIRKDEEFPISGFPRSLQQEDASSLGMRQTNTRTAERWRSRTASQQKRRKKWTQPLPNRSRGLHRVKSLTSYSKADYLVGNSTPMDLLEAKDRLGADLQPMPVELSATEGLVYEMADTSISAELADTSAMYGREGVPSVRLETTEERDEVDDYSKEWRTLAEKVAQEKRQPWDDYTQL